MGDVVVGCGAEDAAQALCAFHAIGAKAVALLRLLPVADEVDGRLSGSSKGCC